MDEVKMLEKTKTILSQELEDATEQIIKLEEKAHEVSTASIANQKQLNDLELENNKLLHHISDLKTRIPEAIYIPIRDDEIDNFLASFLNNLKFSSFSFTASNPIPLF